MTRLNFRFTESADREIIEILETTNKRFGPAASRRYEVLIGQAVRDLTEDPARVGVQSIGGRLHYHIRHSRNRVPGHRVREPRHILVCKIVSGVLVVMAVGHDAMEEEMTKRIEEGEAG